MIVAIDTPCLIHGLQKVREFQDIELNDTLDVKRRSEIVEARTAAQVLNDLAAKNGTLVIAPMVLAEFLCHFDDAEQQKYLPEITALGRIPPIDTATAVRAARLWRNHTPAKRTNATKQALRADTFVLAVALQQKADMLITSDGEAASFTALAGGERIAVYGITQVPGQVSLL